MIAPKWKQPKCVSQVTRKKKKIYTMEHYPAMKRSRLLIVTMNLGGSYGHYAKRKNPVSKYHRFHNPTYVTSQNEKIILAKEDRLEIARSFVKGEM